MFPAVVPGRAETGEATMIGGRWARAAMAAVVIVLTMGAPAAAGPLDDALDAYTRGEIRGSAWGFGSPCERARQVLPLGVRSKTF